MTGFEIFLLVVYVIGTLIAWPIIARMFYKDCGCGYVEDYVFSLLLGLCFAALWPLGSALVIFFPLKWLFFPESFKEDRVKERVNKFIRRS